MFTCKLHGLPLALSPGSCAHEIAPQEQRSLFISFFMDWSFRGGNAIDPRNQDSVLNMPANWSLEREGWCKARKTAACHRTEPRDLDLAALELLLRAVASAAHLNASPSFFLRQVGTKPGGKCVSFAGHTVSMATTQHCHCSTKAALDNV